MKSLCFSQDEIIRALSNSFMDHRIMAPDYEREQKQKANRKTISPLGGIAAALNKEADIFRVLREYKGKHQHHTMTTACANIVNAGTLAYSNREKLIKRLSDIGKRMNPVKSPSQIYAEL